MTGGSAGRWRAGSSSSAWIRTPMLPPAAAGIVEARAQTLDSLRSRRFRGHQPEHRDRAFGHRGEWREVAGTLVVVLEQQPVHADAGEQLSRDVLVAAGDQPAAGLVALAEVEAGHHARAVAEHVVVELGAEAQPTARGPAAAGVEVAVALLHEQRVVRRVELDVRAAEAGELVDLGAQDLGDVAEERLERGVRLPRALGIPEAREQARARQRDLRDGAGAAAQVHELLHCDPAPPPQRCHDAEGRHLHATVAVLVAVPFTPQERVEVPLPEALDRLEKLALERQAPLFPVGRHRQAGRLLGSDDLVDRPVLDAFEGRRGELPPVAALTGDEQRLGTQQAADDVGPHGAERADVSGVQEPHSIRPSSRRKS